jgi:4-amino-4-deoxy-L-arabinose transferase-like glycosyltransferase
MPRRLLVLLALSLAALLLLFKLDYAPFWNPDEGRYSAASYEMAFGLDGRAPDWTIPHLNTVARLNKPPLIYWTTAGMFRLFGANEVAGRLPSALAAVLVLFVVFLWGRAAFGTKAGAGVAAALVWATSAFPFAMGRVANTDMQLCACIALASFGIYWSIESRRKLLFGAIAGVGMGLALLSKGPVGLAFPLIIGALYLTAVRGWKKAPWGALAAALAVALAIGAPWYLAVEAQRPGWIKQFILEENLGRFSGKEHFHDKTSPLFYLPILIAGMLPWTGLMLASLRRFEPISTRAGRAKLFFLLWTGFITLFFSLSGTKLVSYVLPAFPALALFTGGCLANYEMWSVAQRRLGLGLSLLFNLVLGVAVAVKPGILLNDKMMPRDVGTPWAFIVVAALVFGSAFLLLTARRPSSRNLLGAQAAAGFLLLGLLMSLADHIAVYEDGSDLVRALHPHMAKDDRLGIYLAFLPTAIVYAERPVTFFGFLNKSGLDDDELKSSPYFLSHEQIGAFVQKKPGRSFVITSGPIWPQASQGLFPWGRNNDWFLYGSVPKPAGFQFEFYAPRRKDRKIKNPYEVPEGSSHSQ